MRQFILVLLRTLGIGLASTQNFSRPILITMKSMTSTTTVTTFASYPCDLGWLFWDEHCYKVFNQYLYDGLAAKYSCISQGAYLVKIDSDAENEFLSSLMTNVVLTQEVWVSR